jgi:predicted regulator of Ras-like GTPase activity (Roadblock/LC7/MglB family)
MTASDTQQFSFLLDNFVSETVGVEDALAVSADGIRLAVSDGLPEAMADQFGAITSGLASLTLGAARCFAEDSVHRVIIEMDRSYLLIVNITHGAVLGVVARKDADIGLVAYEMTLLAERAGQVLTPDLIVELKNTLSV